MTLRKFAAVAAISMFAASPALAASSSSDAVDIYKSWEHDVQAVFFNDDMTMRTKEEVTADWQKLGAEKQALVKADCSRATYESKAERTSTTPRLYDIEKMCGYVQSM